MKRLSLAFVLLLPACNGWPPNPQPTPSPTATPLPPHTDECQALLDQGLPWCHETEPPMQCGECVHNPTQDPRACEKAPDCAEPPPELPEPQCESFMDRGGTVRPLREACDCYFGQVWYPCATPGECLHFPQGVPDEDFTGGETLTTLGTQVNAAIERVTHCPKGTDCVVSLEPDQFYWAVNDELRAVGLWAGRHDDDPPGASDEIAVATSCEGWWQSYHIYNFGGGKVVWAPGSARPAYRIEPKWCPTDCSGAPPEPQVCPPPRPDMGSMKFNYTEHNGILDTTLTTVMQCDFCEEIGMGYFNGQPRCGCPVRPECGPNDPPEAICHERAPCEAELCNQQWTCNGVPEPGWNGNQAQSACRGHWRTWCENAPNVVAEGNR